MYGLPTVADFWSITIFKMTYGDPSSPYRLTKRFFIDSGIIIDVQLKKVLQWLVNLNLPKCQNVTHGLSIKYITKITTILI